MERWYELDDRFMGAMLYLDLTRLDILLTWFAPNVHKRRSGKPTTDKDGNPLLHYAVRLRDADLQAQVQGIDLSTTSTSCNKYMYNNNNNQNNPAI